MEQNFLGPNIFLDLYSLGTTIFGTNEVTHFGVQILFQKPNCTWEWSLTLALAKLVLVSNHIEENKNDFKKDIGGGT